MNRRDLSTIRIGVADARVTSVTRERLEYLDEAGQAWSVDLEQCARNWVSYRQDHDREFVTLSGGSAERAATWNSRCVGRRGVLDVPPWVVFMDDRHTRFQFETQQAVYQYLLLPLRMVGWHTFDSN